jgi:hypothetical protein
MRCGWYGEVKRTGTQPSPPVEHGKTEEVSILLLLVRKLVDGLRGRFNLRRSIAVFFRIRAKSSWFRYLDYRYTMKGKI